MNIDLIKDKLLNLLIVFITLFVFELIFGIYFLIYKTESISIIFKPLVNTNLNTMLQTFRDENYDFNNLRDAAINGNIKRTNNLMSDTILDEFQSSYYLNSINLRLQKIKDIIDQKEEKNEST